MYDILIILVCMFASLGIVELAIYFFNRNLAKQLPHKFYILADNFGKDDAEYVIRFLEGLISRCGLDSTICGIQLGENIQIDEALLTALTREFPNIVKNEDK